MGPMQDGVYLPSTGCADRLLVLMEHSPFALQAAPGSDSAIPPLPPGFICKDRRSFSWSPHRIPAQRQQQGAVFLGQLLFSP